MASIRQLREAIAGVLDAIPDVQVSAYVKASPTLPCIQIVTGPRVYHGTMQNGIETQTFMVQARAAYNDELAPQMTLDRLMESTAPDGVKAVLEADDTLGGLVDQLVVTEASGIQLQVPASGGLEIIIEWTVEVYGTGVA